jgi:TetR/AcrR family transcriptional repressor of nem operon
MEGAVHPSKSRILDAAIRLIRTQGYAATRIEDVCAAAGLTKGSFFHHFKTKEELAVAAADHWSAITGELFREAPYHAPTDPLDRLLAYVDFRHGLVKGDLPDFTCLAGTMVQETYSSDPAIRAACGRSIRGHAETLEADIAEAMERHGIRGEWTPGGLALHIQAVIQGAFVMAKATGGAEAAIESLAHLRRYLELLFTPTKPGTDRRRKA